MHSYRIHISLFNLFLMLLLVITGLLSAEEPGRAAGTISLTGMGETYIQDFDTLAASGTSSTVPDGWDFSESGTNANTTYNSSTGSNNAGDTYSFGSSGSPERAFGGLLSGSLVPTIGASFTNDTGESIASLEISYTGEQWRLGALGREDRLDFQYSTDATSLTTGTWINVDDLDFTAPVTIGTVGAVDGNNAANQTTASFLITGIGIPQGGTIWLRWADFNATGADDGLAVDDFSLTPYSGIVLSNPLINEFVANHVGTDTNEYVEIFGDANADYSDFSLLQIEGDGTGAGVIDSVHAVGTTNAGGFWTTGFLANAFENGTVTLLLVENFSGAIGNDLDTNNDGTFDSLPWSNVVDALAVSDGGAGDLTYSTTVLAPGFNNSSFTPGGASRIPNGVDTDSVSDWTLNDFDGEGLPGFEGTPDPGEAINTPGETNTLVPVGFTSIVISQVYGGGGNSGATLTHDFIELYNRGTTTVALDGWTVQYASAAGTSWAVTNLSGTLLPEQYYLIQQAQGAAGTMPLPSPDAVGAIAMAATAGKVALVNNSTSLTGSCPTGAQIADFVGYGTTANCFEGSGPTPAPSNTTAVLRSGNGSIDTDNNAADFSAGSPDPRNRSFGLDQAPAVTSTSPSNGALDVPVTANIIISFSENVNVSGNWFSITCTTSGVITATASGGPLEFTLDPDVDLAEAESCTVTAFANQITDQDLIDPPDNMEADYSFSFSTVGANVCETTFTPVYEIQGSGSITPFAGQTTTTQGVVVGDYEGPSPTLRGFYLQDSNGDGNTATSDGIFVFNGNNDSVDLGDVVRVTGTVTEFQDQTQISASSVVSCGTGIVEPVDVTLPFPSANYLEQYEGMLIRLPQTLYVTEHFQLGRFGQVVMSSDGRLQQPTNVVPPGSAAQALQAANDLNRIIIDDDLNNQNPDPILFGRGGQPLSANNTLRGGDTSTDIIGIMTYTWAGNAASGNAYRVRPVNALQGGVPEFQPVNTRPDTPAEVGGSLKVAAMNLLNYFNTFSGCTNGVSGAPTDCRGAQNQLEFDRQSIKTVEAIIAMNPDVLGVIEIENDGYGPLSAMQELVNRLNAASVPGTFAFIDVDAGTGQVNALGTDAIKVGIVYKPAKVTPVGATAALNSVAFVNGGDSEPRNRPALAQAFEQFSNGGRFTVVVNHLKSKGSACTAPDTGDGQGNCNIVRLNAANELAAWLSSDPTGTGDADFLILGDLNSYAKEDPITALLSAGYTNLIESFSGPNAYSYVFDGQWGYLDHALGSTSVASQVTGVTEWHINSDEPSVLDYNTDFKSAAQITSLFAPDQFRVSDHDPVIIGLDLDGVPQVSASPSEQTVQYSDLISPVTVTGEDDPSDFPLDAVTQWNFNGGAFTSGLPAGLSFINNPCGSTTCTWTLEGTATTAPGSYVIRVIVDDNDEGSGSIDIAINITQEDALSTYTGALFAATSSTTSSTATITLAATIQDINDGFPGDIRNATVTFVDRDNGNSILCSNLPVGLVNSADTTMGTATCTWDVNIGNADSFSARVGIIVGGYYVRNATADDSIVTISRALSSNFITGGGYLLLSDSNGMLAGDPGSRNNIGLHVKYNKGGRNLQGRVNVLVISAGRVYQIKSNVLNSLVVDPAVGTAVFNGRANIQDVTDPDNPFDVDGNTIIQVTMTDNGEPGSSDSIGITVWNRDGGLYFASHWNGVQTIEQVLGGGNLIVH